MTPPLSMVATPLLLTLARPRVMYIKIAEVGLLSDTVYYRAH